MLLPKPIKSIWTISKNSFSKKLLEKSLKLVILPLLNNIIACAPQAEFIEPPKQFEINPDFKQYTESFQNEIGEKVELNMTYAPQEYPIIAICYYYPNHSELNYIEVDQNNWNESSENTREEIIFHELGHCILGRDHDNNVIEGYNVPKSIMYPYVFESAFINYREYYTSELKNSQIDWTKYFQ